jgi:hypothetical protein
MASAPAAAAGAAAALDTKPKPVAAAAEEDAGSSKKTAVKKVPITDSEKNLQRLREARVQQKKNCRTSVRRRKKKSGTSQS